MKNIVKLLITPIFTLVFIWGSASAADPVLTASCTFTLEVKALSMYSGETALPTSKGVLTFQGKEHPFTLQALTMGNNFGSSTLKASGIIYAMKDPSQFESPFFMIGGGINPGEGNEIATYKNSKGVIVVMTGSLNGPLWMPASGAAVKFIK